MKGVMRILDEFEQLSEEDKKEMQETIVKEIPKVPEANLVLIFLLLCWLLSKISAHRITIGYEEATEILEKALGSECDIMLLDLDKDVPTRNEVLRFLQKDKTDLEIYMKDGIYDCDKFARHLWGRLAMGPKAIKKLRPGTRPWARTSFGISWSRIHMYNMLIDQPKRDIKMVSIVEPQNDYLLAPNELKNIEIPCTKEIFGGEAFWIPEWEAFALYPRLGMMEAVATKVTNTVDASIKLKRDLPLPFARLTAKEKRTHKDKINLKPYGTVRMMM